MDLRNLKKNQKSDQSTDLNKLNLEELSNLNMSNSLPINPFSQINPLNFQQLLGKAL